MTMRSRLKKKKKKKKKTKRKKEEEEEKKKKRKKEEEEEEEMKCHVMKCNHVLRRTPLTPLPRYCAFRRHPQTVEILG